VFSRVWPGTGCMAKAVHCLEYRVGEVPAQLLLAKEPAAVD
jgi:hypothetical protein